MNVSLQFAGNFPRIKGLIKKRAGDKRSREDHELRQIEKDIYNIYDLEGGGYVTQESKDSLVNLQGKRNTIVLDKEETWILKSRAIWLECGDENTKFFHSYARGRKVLNTIWILEDSMGRTHETFEDMASLGFEHFQQLFQAPEGSQLMEIMHIAQVFPHFVGEEDNLSLMEEVIEEELKMAL